MPPARPGGIRRLLVDAGQLAGLWGMAVAQPLFELLERGEVLAAAGWRGGELVSMALGLCLLPPAGLALVELAVGRASPRARAGLHRALLAALTAVFAMYVVKQGADPPGWVLVVVGALAAAGMLLALRARLVRALLTALAAAPLLFAATFLLATPVRQLVFPAEAAAGAVSPRPVPVVMVVFDELPTISLMRDDARLDAAAYPSFASLARSATWYRNAASVYDSTSLAVPAVLTGRLGGTRTLASDAAQPQNLFTLVRRTHAVHGHETLTRLCPARMCPDNRPASVGHRVGALVGVLAISSARTFLPNSIVELLPDPLLGPLPPPAPDPFDRLSREILAERRPGFFFVHHSLVPHQPWERLPSGQRYDFAGCCPRDLLADIPSVPLVGLGLTIPTRWGTNRWLVVQEQQRHLAQTRYADRLLGRVLAAARRAGIYDRALIVVVADHGIGFQPGAESRGLTPENAGEVLGVPLFVKLPHQRRGRVTDALVRTIDVAPTVARELRVRLPWRAHGAPLSPNPLHERSRPLSAAPSYARSAQPVDVGAFLRQRDVGLARSDSLLRNGPASVDPLFRLGPHPSLIGRRVGELPRSPGEGPTVTLTGARELRSMDPGAPVLPVSIAGLVRSGVRADQPVAVALNGRIVAMSRTHRSAAGMRFGVLLPPAALRRGRNVIAVHLVERSRGRLRLTQMPAKAARSRAEPDGRPTLRSEE